MQLASGYLWFKALHVAFMVTWFAGLFYLPRLFIYHTDGHRDRRSATTASYAHGAAAICDHDDRRCAHRRCSAFDAALDQ